MAIKLLIILCCLIKLMKGHSKGGNRVLDVDRAENKLKITPMEEKGARYI